MVGNLPETLGMKACWSAPAREEQVRSSLREHVATAKRKGRATAFVCKWCAWYIVLRNRTPKFSFFGALRYGLWLAQG
jgi:hypothetical protein